MAKAVVEYDKEVGSYDILWVTESRYDWKDKIAGLILILKSLPASDRSYDPISKKWTILEKHWKNFETVIRGSNVRVTVTEKVPLHEWHYEQVTTSTAPSKDTLANQLIAILGLELEDLKDEVLLKKAYRKKAFEFHPDRNNGDGAKMSELNSIWSAYNA